MTRGCASAHEVIPGARQPGARTTAMHQAQHVRGAAFGRQAWRQPCTATAPAARLYLHGGSRSSSRPQPGRHRGEVAAHAVQHRDLTTGLLESVVTLALRARLRESRGVECSISADVFSLLAGHVYGARVSGEGWRSPLNLTARTIEATVGATSIDPRALLLRQNVELTNVPVGTLKVVFDAADFGHFLVHPLMNTAVATAVQGHAFVFDPQTVRITAPTPAMPGGEIEFCGTWRRDGGRYRVQLTPVQQGAAVGRGVQAHAVPLSTGGRGSSASIIEDSLGRFFSRLSLDLQGAQLTFNSLTIIPAAGFSAFAELNLRLELKKFPPLHMQF